MKCDDKGGTKIWCIDSKSNDGPDADPDWSSWAEGNLFCAHCRTVKRSLYPTPIDVTLREKPPSTWTIGNPFRVGIPIYRADFADILQLYWPGLVRGRCVSNDQRVFGEYVTLYADTYVLMRGDSETNTKICPLCNSVWSDLVIVYKNRPAYLLRHQLTELRVYQSRCGAIFMMDDVFQTIDWSEFRDLRRQLIEIRDTPLDDRRLPGDPNWNMK